MNNSPLLLLQARLIGINTNATVRSGKSLDIFSAKCDGESEDSIRFALVYIASLPWCLKHYERKRAECCRLFILLITLTSPPFFWDPFDNSHLAFAFALGMMKRWISNSVQLPSTFTTPLSLLLRSSNSTIRAENDLHFFISYGAIIANIQICLSEQRILAWHGTLVKSWKGIKKFFGGQ